VRNVLLIIHVAAAIVFLGPVTFATGAFVRYAETGAENIATAMNRTTRVYGWGSLAVPVFGLALAGQGSYFDKSWVMISLTLFVIGIVLLLAVIVPGQKQAIEIVAAGDGSAVELPSGLKARLSAVSGVYGLLWLVILYFMIAKPG
jgi:uncharacterized membrane protein